MRPAPAPVTVSGQDTTGLSLDLPCTQAPELFFAESPQDVEQAKTMCRGCRARPACLVGALERAEPWGVWGGELLMRGAIVPGKRPRGRPRKVVTIGANAWAAAVDLAQPGSGRIPVPRVHPGVQCRQPWLIRSSAPPPVRRLSSCRATPEVITAGDADEGGGRPGLAYIKGREDHFND